MVVQFSILGVYQKKKYTLGWRNPNLVNVRLFQQGDTTIEVRKELFIEQRKQLLTRMEDMKKTLERLNYKIESYEQAVVKKEKELKRSED